MTHDKTASVCEDGVVRRHLRDSIEGFRILRSREFWQAFRDYWSAEAISARLDAFAARLRGESHDDD